MKRFVLSRDAERDLDQIKQYLVAEAGVRVARRVIREIRSGCALVAADPGVGHSRQDLSDRPLRFWPVYSYLIVYDSETKPVRIVRVLHGMRNVEDILN